MKFLLISNIIFIVLFTAFGKLDLLELSEKPGPLYQGLRLLIVDEKLNAQLVWNDTQSKIKKNSDILQQALHYMQNYGTLINDKLNQINSLEHLDQVKRKCYKQYERQIARFNRNLIQQYLICKEALNSSLSQLKSQIVGEIKYIHDAPATIQEVMHVCNVTDLKMVSLGNHHATVTICVLTNLAEIDQRLLVATQMISRILVHMGIAVADYNKDDQERTTNVCLDFQDLREEFQTIYDSIIWCINENK